MTVEYCMCVIETITDVMCFNFVKMSFVQL